ncbi:hypothetical protein EON64_20575, partial [archaeon]
MSANCVFSCAGVIKNNQLDKWEFVVDGDSNQESDRAVILLGASDGTASIRVTSDDCLLESSDGNAQGIHRKRKKEQKKRANAAHSAPKRSSTRRSVQWGEVSEVLFSRDIGCMSIPNEGGHPLGLGEKLDVFCYPVASPHTPQRVTGSACVPLTEQERISILAGAGSSNKQAAAAVNKEVRAIQRSRESVGCSCKPVRPDKLN